MKAKEAYARLAEHDVDFFTIHDLAQRFALAPADAQHLAFRMARGEFARRVRRGLYALVDPDDWRTAEPRLAQDWYLAAAAIAAPTPYFLAYYTAMEIHRMTQNPIATIFVAVPTQRNELVRPPVRFRFVRIGERRFFGYEDIPVRQAHTVVAADLERTFLDCVDRPELCGGLEEIFRGFARRNRELDRDRLLHYVQRFDRPFMTKRLGFLLEAVGHDDPRLLWDLERVTKRTKQYVPLDKKGPRKTGEHNKRWEILVNVDLDRLLAAARA